jgi:endonuclease YncB( thermonuclease family)
MNNKLSNDNSVASLVLMIQNEIASAKIKLQNTADSLKTKTYWTIGKYIAQHISLHKDQTEYGKALFPKLSSELDISIRSLYHSYQFFSSYPSITAIKDHLSWGHYKILLTVKSEEERDKFTKYLLKNKISTRDFFVLVKNEIGYDSSHKGRILPVIHGVPFVYKLKKINGKLHLDLGFHSYYKQVSDRNGAYDENTLIRVKKDKKYSFKKANLDKNILFTYKAYIDSIVDGDTIVVNIDLGFEVFSKQRLRLNGISADELYTNAGKKAKNFVVSKLSGIDFVVIKTYCVDKYYRYVADVFYSNKYREINTIISKGKLLNQDLLDSGLAKRYYMM